MSHRLQVLISPELDAELRKAAERGRMSKGEWVRRAINKALQQPGKNRPGQDPVMRLAGLRAPTAGIDQMLSEIEAGRS
jgi:Ribbon-helix-helix protein, copG family